MIVSMHRTFENSLERIVQAHARRFAVLTAATVALVAGLTTLGAPAGVPGSPASAYAQSNSCAGAISWRQARSAIGRTATVRGRVAGTHFAASSNGQPTFLNIGVDYPDSRRLTVVIWIQDRARFGRPEIRYRGHTVCVRGA